MLIYSMSEDALTNISPIDGRYCHYLQPLRPIFSEYGLMRARVRAEISWFHHLSQLECFTDIPLFDPAVSLYLENIYQHFSVSDARRIKDIETSTNHDVKSVEYYLGEEFQKYPALKPYISFIHFCCTSEDINSVAYGLMVKQGLYDCILPEFDKLLNALACLKQTHQAIPLLAKTHGQAAVPTTIGKEFSVFFHRLKQHRDALKAMPIRGKFNGAVGNYNAHFLAYPKIDWLAVTKEYLRNLELEPNVHTTQIESHDDLAALLDCVARCCHTLEDLCCDIWGYISRHIFTQKNVASEIGSSTMPQKINPIDFEHAEGNLGIASSLATHLSANLPVSRWQRDLSDSTALRSMGSVFAYFLLSMKRINIGLGKLTVNTSACESELSRHPEVVTEAIQTILRKHRHNNAYEQLKTFARGRRLTQEAIHNFIRSLDIPAADQEILLQISPHNYLGIARELAQMP